MGGKLLLFLHPFRVTPERSVDNLECCLQSSGRFSSPFQWFFQPSGMVSSVFSSRLEDFLHFHSEYFSGLLEWFLLFFNLLMKNEKEILIKCIYLFTLLFFRSFQILFEGFTCFWLLAPQCFFCLQTVYKL